MGQKKAILSNYPPYLLVVNRRFNNPFALPAPLYLRTLTLLKNAAQLQKEQQGIIRKLPEGPLQVKLMEMGCLPGELIRLIYKAPFGDPLCFEVSGYTMMIRRKEAAQIEVEL
jgi:ferrous iron transport protein A